MKLVVGAIEPQLGISKDDVSEDEEGRWLYLADVEKTQRRI